MLAVYRKSKKICMHIQTSFRSWVMHKIFAKHWVMSIIIICSLKARLRCSNKSGFDQSLSNLSTLTSRLALAISLLPLALKSNSHSCTYAYLCDPQNMFPHLNWNPVRPTFLLHWPHLFFFSLFSSSFLTTLFFVSNAADAPHEESWLRSTDGKEFRVGLSVKAEFEDGLTVKAPPERGRWVTDFNGIIVTLGAEAFCHLWQRCRRIHILWSRGSTLLSLLFLLRSA